MDGRYLNQVCFGSKIVVISSELDEMKNIILDLKLSSEQLGLKINLT